MQSPASAGGDKESTENTRKPTAESWLPNVLSTTAQAASLVGIIGFVLAIIINSMIFRQWGLNFLQVATPGDVVLAGFHGALVLAFPITAIVLGWICGKYLAIKVSLVWQVLFLIACIVFYNVVRIEIGAQLTKIEHLVAFFSGGVFWGIIYYAEFAISGKDFSRGAKGVTAAVLGVLVVVAVAPPTLLANHQSGMFADGEGYGLVPVPADCLAPYVLWTGERAIVTRCRNGRIMVLMYPQALLLDRVRPVSALTQSRPAQPIEPLRDSAATNSQTPTPRPGPR